MPVILYFVWGCLSTGICIWSVSGRHWSWSPWSVVLIDKDVWRLKQKTWTNEWRNIRCKWRFLHTVHKHLWFDVRHNLWPSQTSNVSTVEQSWSHHHHQNITTLDMFWKDAVNFSSGFSCRLEAEEQQSSSGPLPKHFYVDWCCCNRRLCLFLGLYGNEGLLPARWQLRYSGKPLGEQLLSSPTLLWLGPWLGLDTHTAMELLCLVGAVLSLAATLVEALRDSVVFFCLWALYLSMYQVSLQHPVGSFNRLLLWFPFSHTGHFFHFRWARYFSTSSGEWWFAHLWLFYIRFKFFVSIIVFVTSQLCLSVDYVDWQPWFHLTCHTFLLLFLLTRVQGQLASGDGVPLHPCCAIDNNQRVTRGQRARSRDLLAGTLAALQAHVCIWCGKTHITLSHLVGPHRCVSVLLCLFIRSEHYKNVSVTQKITTV